MKKIPENKTVCKTCTTPNICKEMGAFSSCRLRNVSNEKDRRKISN